MITAGIIGAEIAFWVALATALAIRYLAHRKVISTVVLALLPVIDLALLTFVIMDLLRGTAPSHSHALAASYLGFTVAFGHSMVRWADARFAHRFAGGPKPQKPVKGTAGYVRGLWVEWLKVLLAVGISAVILVVLGTVVLGQPIPTDLDAAKTNPIWAQLIILGLVVIIWFLAGPAFARVKRTGATR